jgi:hypothetical protein
VTDRAKKRSFEGDLAETRQQLVLHDVVVSYSRRDGDRVRPFVQELQEAGVSVWIDQKDIDGAQPWGQKIAEAIDTCKVLLFMASPASITSKGVIREVALAYDAEKTILPLHLEPVELPTALRYQLAGIQHIEVYPDGDDRACLNAVLRSLRGLGVTVSAPSKRPRSQMLVGQSDADQASLMPAPGKDPSQSPASEGARSPTPTPTPTPTSRTRWRLNDWWAILLGLAAAIVLVGAFAVVRHSSGNTTGTTGTDPTTGGSTGGSPPPAFPAPPTEATSYVQLGKKTVDVLSLRNGPGGKVQTVLPQGTGGIRRIGRPTRDGWQNVDVDGLTGWVYASYLRDGSGIAPTNRAAVVQSLGYNPVRTTPGPEDFVAIVADRDEAGLGHLEVVLFFQGDHLLGIDGLPARGIGTVTFDAATATVAVPYMLFDGRGAATRAGKTAVAHFERSELGMRLVGTMPPVDPAVADEAQADASYPASVTGHR